ncbi:MAG: amino acid adenylation domain-containing protein [Lachnospiraceae bacterium]|nr:amino acid adenylation domain-containing protein [Lachnospiraceae bacterium]
MKETQIKYPLSQTELGIFLACQQPTTAYNLPHLIPLPEALDPERFRAAVEAFFVRHPGLFSRITIGEDGSPVRVIVPGPVVIEEKELGSLEEVPLSRFEIQDAPLYRLAFYRVGTQRYFFFDFHHIIFDGHTLGLLLKELPLLYEGRTDLPPEAVSAGEYALQEAARRESPEYEAAKAWYTETFSGIENDPALPFDRQESAPRYVMKKQRLAVPASALTPFIRSLGIRSSAFFLGAFSWLLAKMNGEKEAFLATVHNGRTPETANASGMFVKTLPFYVKFTDDETVADYLRKASEEMTLVVRNDLYSFADAAKDLGASGEILFAYQGDYMFDAHFCGGTQRLIKPDVPDGKGLMSLELHKDGDAYELWTEYRADLYRPEMMAQLAALYDRTLLEFTRRGTLGEIELLDETQSAILEENNAADLSALDLDRTVVDYFYRSLENDPDHPLVVFKDRSYTYAQAEDITNRLAARLIELGAGREKVVSVLIPKCEYTMLASLGVLKSGAAYQPLDPTYPRERLNFMIKDADACALILDRALEGLLNEYEGPRVYLDEIPGLPAAERPAERPRPEDLFIMLYTSGTTGVPKGVMLEHRNILAFCLLNNKRYDETAASRMSAYASYGFDADMMDLYPAVTCGGTVYMIPEEMRLDLLGLGDYFNEVGITHSFITTQVGRQFVEAVDLKTVQHFFVGGERLVPLDPPENFVFHNVYGPTEGTIFCCEQPVLERYYSVPIGKHLEDYKFYVLDEHGRRLPWGVKGELYISGPQVGRGYLNRPEENKKAFLSNPFETDPLFAKLYKTGDVVRFLQDGTVDFIGRSDGQVKIRGFRVEMAEVEEIIRRFPGIKDATVKDFTDPAGVKFIAAYVVSDDPVDIEALCAFIGRNKPPYMIPACVMQIEKIPLNQNQKVNKRALPAPQPREVETVPPATETESRIFDILSGILGHSSFGVTTDFSEAGLTSVSSIRYCVQLSKAFGRPFKNSELAAYPTVRALAAHAGEDAPKRDYAARETYPLTKTQEGILVDCLANPGGTAYNIPYLFEMAPTVDPEALAEAVEKAIAAHPYMMSRLEMDETGSVVARREDNEPEVDVIMGRVPADDKLVRPFSLLGDKLYRAEIYYSADSVTLFLDVHHILCDGTSEVILLRDISDAFSGGEPEPETYSGYEIALDETEDRKGPRMKEAKAWYDALLLGKETDFRMKKALKPAGVPVESLEKVISVSRSSLEAFAERGGFSMNALFNFVFGLVLAKYLYKDEALFTTIYNGRSDSRTLNTVSMLVKTLPVTVQIRDDAELISVLREMKAQLEGSQNHDIFSFAEIASAYGVAADNLFVYHGADFSFDHIGPEPVKSRTLEIGQAKAPFHFVVFPKDDGFLCRLEADGSLYDQDAMASFLRCFTHVLEQVEHVRLVGEIEYVTDEDLALYERFNDTMQPVPPVSYNKLMEAQAARVPDRMAVIAQDGRYTYRELNEAANRIAHALRESGAAASGRVVALMPRVKDAYAIRLGILKSGAAFVPVDPKYPDDRIEYIITESGAGAVITTAAVAKERADMLARAGAPVCDVAELMQHENAADPDWEIDPDGLAYLIFTSGSTGKPKGVMIAQHNLVNLCLDGKNCIKDVFGAAGDDEVICGAFASLSFDVSVQEQFFPLSHGFTVVIASEADIANPFQLAELFEREHVDICFMTPSYVSNAADMPPFIEALKRMKVLYMGGEALPAELYVKLRQSGVETVIYNGYGPTETTVFSTFGLMTDEFITIGKPVGNTKLYLLDPHGHILPIGAIGDLTIAGDGVGRGYLHLPDKTAERYITVDGLPAFRSGDMARYNTEGNIEFFGRLDNQVKLRGLRVELDEIIKAISSYGPITSAIVVVKNNAAEGDYLAAYYTASEEVDKDELRAFIGRTLTPYMIPHAMMQLEKLPLTPNGKVDKKALPEPAAEESSSQPVRKPKGELEKQIAGLFSKALGRSGIGRDEDFFDLGGTSLSASKVAMLAVGASLPIAYGDVFEFPTVADMAAHIKQVRSGAQLAAAEEALASGLPTGEDVLAHNTLRFLDGIRPVRPLGRVLLTGATGFLGIHILRELLRQEVPVLALCRGTKDLDAELRLKGMLMYYFDSPLDEEVDRLVKVADGDVTNADLSEILKDETFDTIINCAALVKHFAADDIIERVNVGGVENMIELALERNARLVQISTVSVAGENVGEKFPETFRLFENQLAVGQDISNKYIHSKYMGEKVLYEAVQEKGLDGKVVRVGNLMGRQSDGEFQINSVTNGFIRNLKGYKALGCFPVTSCDSRVDFSPIDETAKAILLLAQTPKEFTTFHAANSHPVEMGDIIAAMNAAGFAIETVPEEEFNERLGAMLADETANMLVSSLINYASSDQKVHQFIQTDNRFSIKALYRLGFKWPITDETYLTHMLEALQSLDYFERTDI